MAGAGQGGPILSEGLGLKYGGKIIHHTAFHTLLLEGAPNLEASLGAGTPAIIESAGVTASELAGFRLDAADEVYTLLGLGDLDIDLSRDVHARVVYAVEEAAKSGQLWAAWIKGLKFSTEELLSDAKVAADGTIAWAAEPANVGAGAIKATPWRSFNITNVLAGDDYAMIAVELDGLGTATADKVFFQALELRWTRAMTAADETRQLT